jgi:hypothetical protein
MAGGKSHLKSLPLVKFPDLHKIRRPGPHKTRLPGPHKTQLPDAQSKEMSSLMDYFAKSTNSVSVPSMKKTLEIFLIGVDHPSQKLSHRNKSGTWCRFMLTTDWRSLPLLPGSGTSSPRSQLACSRTSGTRCVIRAGKGSYIYMTIVIRSPR